MRPFALTLGDPAGIGPEVVLKALAVADWRSCCQVIGSRWVLEQTYAALKERTLLADPATLTIVDLPTEAFVPAQIQPSSGDAGFRYLKAGIDLVKQGHCSALVTAPIAKQSWHQAGHRYPGQTEVIAQGYNPYAMMFAARSPHTGWCWRMMLATTHIPLIQVPQVLNRDLVQQKLDLLLRVLQDSFGITDPQVHVAGLNPHSGEGGQLGLEERDWLAPLLRHYPQVQGPVPPDTMWLPAGRAWFAPLDPVFSVPDGYLALYHDQGLAPLKLLAFDQAVNITVGLPFIRTSPDHGTAFDRVGQGTARATSMLEAFYWAKTLTPFTLGAVS